MSNENVPMDALAAKSEQVVRAALDWAWSIDAEGRMTAAEWRLLEAAEAYGDSYKGLRSQ
jgi:hypothetical protein